jgi:hypothetical protein
MRVTWVHPSWRDLVIEHLGGSAQRRRAFLDACGLAGIELALSTAGGPTGTRRLPLVTGDDDWDALGDAIHRLSRHIAQDELARMLSALETAIVDAGTRERAELEAIAELALNTVRRRLDHDTAVIDAYLLERWHALARQLAQPPGPPTVGHTLAALDPAGAHPSNAASVQRLDHYLAVIEATGQPLPDGIAEELAAFVRAAERGGELPAATRAVLRRIARVHARLAPRTLALLDEDATLQARTAIAEPIPPPPPDDEGQRVRRILADL